MSGSEALPNSHHKLDLRRLVLVGAGLPIAAATLTYVLMAGLIAGGRSVLETTIGYGGFVLEVGLVGVVVGRAMPYPMFRWLLYGWMMVLIDLLVGSMAMISSDSYVSKVLPAAALVAAQIGLAILWGTMGTSRWYWRIPSALGLGAGLLGFWVMAVPGNGRLIGEILVMQAIVLTLLSGGLRISGYRLMPIDVQAQDSAGRARSRFQFGIRDVLVWTTVLAVLLAVMRGAGMLVWVSLIDHPAIYFKGTVAFFSAMVIVFALWAALGRGHWLLRYSLLVIVLLSLGTAMGSACANNGRLMKKWLPQPTNFDYDLYLWYEVGWWWIAWMFLSGGLLAASLMIFRAVGYRLVRSTKAAVHVAK